jgi:hypothetical protein
MHSHHKMLLAAASVFALTVALAAPATAAGLTDYKSGKGASPVTGSAGTNGSSGDAGLDHCDKPMGAMAVVEPQDFVVSSLGRYGLQSPVQLIRLMIQQSNCFLVVERGLAMQNLQQERAIADSGQSRQGSNMGGGQMVSADFIMTPSVVFAENNAGGGGAALGGLLRKASPLAGAIAGGLKFKEAQTMMTVADARSGVQVVAAEGSTRKADFRLSAALFGGSGFGSAGAYGNTNEGKIIAAAFLDNYKKVVATVKGDASLQREVRTLKQEAVAGGKTAAGAVFNEGDVVTPKIGNVKLMGSAAETAKTVATLAKGAELIVLSATEQDGFINVQGDAGAGWVKRVLLSKQ